MSNPKQHFDFSLDAKAFKERLAQELHISHAKAAMPLEDDELEFVNAAGVPHLPPKEEDYP